MCRKRKCLTLMDQIRMRRKVDNQNTITQSGEYQNIRHLSTEVSHG